MVGQMLQQASKGWSANFQLEKTEHYLLRYNIHKGDACLDNVYFYHSILSAMADPSFCRGNRSGNINTKHKSHSPSSDSGKNEVTSGSDSWIPFFLYILSWSRCKILCSRILWISHLEKGGKKEKMHCMLNFAWGHRYVMGGVNCHLFKKEDQSQHSATRRSTRKLWLVYTSTSLSIQLAIYQFQWVTLRSTEES